MNKSETYNSGQTFASSKQLTHPQMQHFNSSSYIIIFYMFFSASKCLCHFRVSSCHSVLLLQHHIDLLCSHWAIWQQCAKSKKVFRAKMFQGQIVACTLTRSLLVKVRTASAAVVTHSNERLQKLMSRFVATTCKGFLLHLHNLCSS